MLRIFSRDSTLLPVHIDPLVRRQSPRWTETIGPLRNLKHNISTCILGVSHVCWWKWIAQEQVGSAYIVGVHAYYDIHICERVSREILVTNVLYREMNY